MPNMTVKNITLHGLTGLPKLLKLGVWAWTSPYSEAFGYAVSQILVTHTNKVLLDVTDHLSTTRTFSSIYLESKKPCSACRKTQKKNCSFLMHKTPLKMELKGDKKFFQNAFSLLSPHRLSPITHCFR